MMALHQCRLQPDKWGEAALISRDDQRELNNLGKMLPEQGQGHMMVIDEAKAARDVLEIAREFLSSLKDGDK